MNALSSGDFNKPRNREAWLSAVLAFAVLILLYGLTAAPDLTFWDASELATAADTMGIPHPPGTPLWVMLGRVAIVVQRVFQPGISAIHAVTNLSVLSASLTGALLAFITCRWVGKAGAVSTAVLSGSFYSVWNNATETEVYAVAVLASVVLLVLGEYAGRLDISNDTRTRVRALIAFVAGLAVPLHLSVLVALPATVLLAWGGKRPSIAEVVRWLLVGALGFSAVAILPFLASHDPALNSGNPVTLSAVIDVLLRKQYDVAGLWPRRAPLWLQIGNVFQWADWQAGLGLEPHLVTSVRRAALTILFALFGAVGLVRLWSEDARVGRAMLTLIVTASIGVALWLNLLAGPSFGGTLIPAGFSHEARERDYFFALAFLGWGLLAGVGLSVFRKLLLSSTLPKHRGWRRQLMAALPLLIAFVPAVLNWRLVNRRSEPNASLPRIYGRMLLDAVPDGGVLFTAGDNDTFPLWYLQYSEGYRTDVHVVAVPLLGAQWYRTQLARKQLLPSGDAAHWRGLNRMLGDAMSRAREHGRAVRVSSLLSPDQRALLQPGIGWVLEGLVYRPDAALFAGETLLDRSMLEKNSAVLPRFVLAPLKVGADPALFRAQQLIRCAVLPELPPALLVSQCNGT